MDPVPIKIVTKDPKWLPIYKSEGAAGADIVAAIQDPVLIQPGHVVMVPTGITLEIPPGYEVQIRPRSGLASQHQITVLNTPGTIDSDYRGEVQVLLINHGNSPFCVTPGMRIAQMVAAPVTRATFLETESLSSTTRGSGGFGHTGV
jgi:dUTP pyrophosphatase